MKALVLSPWSPGWTDAFAAERAAIASALGCEQAAVHHIGSTAIPGMIAHPARAADYAAAKRAVAQGGTVDRKACQAAKAGVVEAILAEASSW